MLSNSRYIYAFTTIGLVVGLLYSVIWANTLGQFLMGGSTFAILSIVSAYMGYHSLWKHRNELAEPINISKLQRQIGNGCILFGTALFLTGFGRLWFQALGWIIVLGGTALTHWGSTFFRTYFRAALLIVLSIYPGINKVLEYLWNTLTPQGLLEKMTAWAGGVVLQLCGQQAQVESTSIYLSTSGVEVTSGCNGLPMILTVLWIGLLMFRNQSKGKILTFLIFGIGLAFSFNAVRVAWLALIAVYDNNASFDFWHGSWGAQVFIVPLFLAYYYAGLKMGMAQTQAE